MSLFTELKRRNVFRVAIAYGVVAWVLAQIADLAFENFGAPDWVAKSVLFILMLGFPIAVVFAWAFELTPDGIKLEKDVKRDQSITAQTGRKLNGFIIALLVVAVVVLLVERSFRTAAPPTEEVVATKSADLSIAVLPFDNRSNREEDEFFTEGIHDDLLTTMANIGSMKVISRTSVLEYKDTTKKIPEIARELGVANVLEGGVQRSGDHVRINVQLIDAETDEHLWAQIYDRELTAENLFKIQSEVARAIAEALQATLSPDEAQRLDAVPTDNLQAYEAYLLGRQRWEARTAESTAESVELFLKAIELDPDFAEAWAGLGDAYRHQEPYGGLPRDELFPKAEQAIRRALQIDPDLAEGHAALGGLLGQLGRIDEAQSNLRRAIELNPSYSAAYNWLGVNYNRDARFDDALTAFRRGLEIDPLSAVLRSNVAFNLVWTGQTEEGRRNFDRLIETHPDSPFGYDGQAMYEAVTGRIDKALPWELQSVLKDPADPGQRLDVAWIFQHLGDIASATRWVESAQQLQPDNADVQVAQILLALQSGQVDAAARIAAPLAGKPGWNTSNENIVLEVLAIHDRSEERYHDALDRYLSYAPLFMEPNPGPLDVYLARPALDVVQLLRDTGQTSAAERLLTNLVGFLENRPQRWFIGVGWYLPAAYALAGRDDDALQELRRLVDEGWRFDWWYVLDYHAAFDQLRNRPEYEALRIEVAADMQEQLNNVRLREKSGELPVVPGMERKPDSSGAPPI